MRGAIAALVPLILATGFASAAWDLRRAPTPADRGKVIADGWVASRESLASALMAAYQPGGPMRPGSTGVTAYRAWLSLWKWCDLLSRDQRQEALRLVDDRSQRALEEVKPTGPGSLPNSGNVSPDPGRLREILSDRVAAGEFFRLLLPADLADPPDRPIAESLAPEILIEWINDDEFSRLLFENLSDRDYSPGVLIRLQQMRLANPQKFKEYRALAVALAVVYDQNFPRFWPHRQVHPSQVPIAEIAIADRFKFWTESNESNALLLDLRRLSPGEIKFVVDAPLARSEFEWARKNVRYTRSEFAKAFDAVSYSAERVRSGMFHWNVGEYALENLQRQGGICVDQAYYGMITGKARGLPTLFFTGQGTDGGHAWFGYMKTDSRWELDCGRYKNQNYAVGEALDPQTWLPVSDHKLKTLTQGVRQGLEFPSSQDDILIGRLHERAGNGAKALRAYESAMQVCPQNEAGWNAKAEYLRRSGAPVNSLKSHHEAALRQFATNRDMRVEQQTALAQIARSQGAPEEAESLERQMVAQNKRKRSDLSVTVAAQKIMSLAVGRQFDQAFTEYRRQAQSLGKTGGGNFFYEIVQPLAGTLVAAGESRRAREVVNMARKALKPENGSIIDSELKDLEKLVTRGSDR